MTAEFKESSFSGKWDNAEVPEFFAVDSEKKAASRIRDNFRMLLEERFGEGGRNGKLEFHGPEHSEKVAERTKMFLETVREIDPSLVSERDIAVAEIEAAGHDLVQNSTEGKKGRRRHRGAKGSIPEELKSVASIGNEDASAAEILAEMGRYRYMDGEPVFPVKNRRFAEEITDDIAATYPDFSMAQLPDGEVVLKIFQPHLLSKSSLRALALASADLRGELASDPGSGDFIRTGDAEFREIRTDISTDLSGGIEALSAARRAEIARDILDWKKTQPGFGKMQKALFAESIRSNKAIESSPKKGEIIAALEELFSGHNFDTNIKMAADGYERLEKKLGSADPDRREERLASMSVEDFRELILAVGYKEGLSVISSDKRRA